MQLSRDEHYCDGYDGEDKDAGVVDGTDYEAGGDDDDCHDDEEIS